MFATPRPARPLAMRIFTRKSLSGSAIARIHLRTASGVAAVAVADGLQAFPVPGQAVRLDWRAEHTWAMAA